MIIPECKTGYIQLLAVAHQYSYGGYWLAKEIGDQGECWRVSPSFGQGCVMSEEQCRAAAVQMEERTGIETHIRFVTILPEGYRILN